jgi:hypothetical protein
MIGWVTKHPILMGGAAGLYTAYRHGRYNGSHDWGRYTKFALIGAGIGLGVYVVKKIICGFANARRRAAYSN